MHKFFNLQLLDNGGQGGAGNGQGGNAGSGNGGQAGNAGNNGGNAGVFNSNLNNPRSNANGNIGGRSAFCLLYTSDAADD